LNDYEVKVASTCMSSPVLGNSLCSYDKNWLALSQINRQRNTIRFVPLYRSWEHEGIPSGPISSSEASRLKWSLTYSPNPVKLPKWSKTEPSITAIQHQQKAILGTLEKVMRDLNG